MRRYSRTGWIPKDEKESITLENCNLDADNIREQLAIGVAKRKGEAEGRWGAEAERVRVSVVVYVERI